MAKRILHHVGKALLFFVVMGAIAPICHVIEHFLLQKPEAIAATLAMYTEPWYWLIVFGAVAVVYPIAVYFKEINPRTFVFIYDVIWSTVFLCLLLAGELIGLLFLLMGVGENRVLLILGLVGLGVVLLFGIYSILCRGVAIYQKGKVRVFKFRIYTYNTDTVDDLRLEYRGKQCIVHVTVQGNEHLFRVSKGSAKLIEKRLKMLKHLGEMEEVKEKNNSSNSMS
ncbi:MAG: hypothetical protein IJW70_08400 [Clostridia bacterium]|nr:hypothetical protein [Clostridia bacterium]